MTMLTNDFHHISIRRKTCVLDVSSTLFEETSEGCSSYAGLEEFTNTEEENALRSDADANLDASLTDACKHDRADMVKNLLEAAAGVNTRTNGWSPLNIASALGHEKVIVALLNATRRSTQLA